VVRFKELPSAEQLKRDGYATGSLVELVTDLARRGE